jgi:hypothetical protein
MVTSEIDNRETLVACSQLSRSWWLASLFSLFRTLFTGRAADGGPRGPATRYKFSILSNFLPTATDVETYVKELAIEHQTFKIA